MYAAISADIVSSTSLCIEETIALKQWTEDLFSILEKRFPGFWGRLIKGDYIECLLPSAKDSFRVALIIKSRIKSFPVAESKEKKLFQTYGIRMAMGIGDMRIVDKEHGIMDGEAIYLSGRTLDEMGTPNKNGTFLIEPADKQLRPALHTIGMLTDALLNNNQLLMRFQNLVVQNNSMHPLCSTIWQKSSVGLFQTVLHPICLLFPARF